MVRVTVIIKNKGRVGSNVRRSCSRASLSSPANSAGDKSGPIQGQCFVSNE